jgi:threonine dehydratase
MYAAASPAKVEASRGYGAEVVLYGTTGSDAFARARELAEQRNLTIVHPFDDEHICAGAGTTGLELLEQADDLDVVVIPVAGAA